MITRGYKLIPNEMPNEVALKVFNGLVEFYRDERKGPRGFYLRKTGEIGIISQCTGLISLLLIANVFDIKNIDINMEIIELVQYIIDYTDKYGFDASPHIGAESTANLFSPHLEERYVYTETLSWVLSAFVLVRKGVLGGVIKIDSNLFKKVTGKIEETLKHILDSATNITIDGKVTKAGWGCMNRCTMPDIYFSYCVSEALADFGDYVLGELDSRDGELIEQLGKEVIEQIGMVRKNTAKWLVRDYLDKMTDTLIGDESMDEKEKLYNNYFILDMLILNNADIVTNQFCEPIDKDGNVLIKKDEDGIKYDLENSQENNEILKKIEHSIYYTRKMYDQFNVDENRINYKITWRNHPKEKDFKNLLSDFPMAEKGLKPLAVRTNMLYVYYINRYPDRKMTEIYNSLIKDRSSSGCYWVQTTFDLLFTEKGIEGLIDYYDYYTKYEETESGQSDLPISTNIQSLDEYLEILIDKKVKEALANTNYGTDYVSDSHEINIDELRSALINTFLSGSNSIKNDEPDKAYYSRLGNELITFFITSMLSRNHNLSKEEKSKYLEEIKKGVDTALKDIHGSSVSCEGIILKLVELALKNM